MPIVSARKVAIANLDRKVVCRYNYHMRKRNAVITIMMTPAFVIKQACYMSNITITELANRVGMKQTLLSQAIHRVQNTKDLSRYPTRLDLMMRLLKSADFRIEYRDKNSAVIDVPNNLNASDTFRFLVKSQKSNMTKVANMFGFSKQNMSQTLRLNSLSFVDFLKVCEWLEIQIDYICTKTGQRIKPAGNIYRKRVYLDGTIEYTGGFDLLAGDFYADGENEFDKDGSVHLLYQTKNGAYILITYFCDKNITSSYRTITESEAQAFIEKYSNR